MMFFMGILDQSGGSALFYREMRGWREDGSAFGSMDDARPPHEQGADALRSSPFWGGEGADGGKPTSRGLPSALRWATLPCPAGQGALRGCGATLFAPAGQRRCGMGAPDFGWFMGKAVCGRVCPSKRAAGAPGRGGELRRRAFHEAAEFPSPSRGENGGLCPHPPKGPVP